MQCFRGFPIVRYPLAVLQTVNGSQIPDIACRTADQPARELTEEMEEDAGPSGGLDGPQQHDDSIHQQQQRAGKFLTFALLHKGQVIKDVHKKMAHVDPPSTMLPNPVWTSFMDDP